MFVVTYTYRQFSNGIEHTSQKIYSSLEDVIAYIRDIWYPDLCEDEDFPASWNENDMGCAFPPKDEFTKEFIEYKMEKKQPVFNPYSNYFCMIPNELLVEEI